ncbi:MAG TPA: energy transducer TonB [Gemmatimonadaceae bacterium]|nr:energy transducer TonB [Gemmatimonadaceae bacterium]
MIRPLSLLPLVLLFLACIDKQTAQKAIEGVQQAEGGVVPDVMPVMRNAELPFRYPPALYARKVQGNVTLRIHIDTTGAVWPESTSVVRSSGYPAFDSAAVEGSRELRFSPASLHGKRMAVSILLPVYFRHPEGRPLPGDTILHRNSTSSPTP